ncbi:hypothetical protein EDD86DRAFT_197014 [Gorgonomyces haynaldii]|nr:hypothetical protein EDD86DRAFT_197014 [Gorgonomyces haynaldii]
MWHQRLWIQKLVLALVGIGQRDIFCRSECVNTAVDMKKRSIHVHTSINVWISIFLHRWIRWLIYTFSWQYNVLNHIIIGHWLLFCLF